MDFDDTLVLSQGGGSVFRNPTVLKAILDLADCDVICVSHGKIRGVESRLHALKYILGSRPLRYVDLTDITELNDVFIPVAVNPDYATFLQEHRLPFCPLRTIGYRSNIDPNKAHMLLYAFQYKYPGRYGGVTEVILVDDHAQVVRIVEATRRLDGISFSAIHARPFTGETQQEIALRLVDGQVRATLAPLTRQKVLRSTEIDDIQDPYLIRLAILTGVHARVMSKARAEHNPAERTYFNFYNRYQAAQIGKIHSTRVTSGGRLSR